MHTDTGDVGDVGRKGAEISRLRFLHHQLAPHAQQNGAAFLASLFFAKDDTV
jgi:hypothetical protein